MLFLDFMRPQKLSIKGIAGKHMTQYFCRIRDLLRSNGQLPEGIDTLRLPRRLQRYIDLMEEIEGPETSNNDDDGDVKDLVKQVAMRKPKKPLKYSANNLASVEDNQNVTAPVITITSADRVVDGMDGNNDSSHNHNSNSSSSTGSSSSSSSSSSSNNSNGRVSNVSATGGGDTGGTVLDKPLTI
uniref:SOCS box domain-containing protein n=1 Tax=Glossina austeni TaxID=7395 RepID=A0A1A9VKL5_GLOAU